MKQQTPPPQSNADWIEAVPNYNKFPMMVIMIVSVVLVVALVFVAILHQIR
jgi:hypothetical protein